MENTFHLERGNVSQIQTFSTLLVTTQLLRCLCGYTCSHTRDVIFQMNLGWSVSSFDPFVSNQCIPCGMFAFLVFPIFFQKSAACNFDVDSRVLCFGTVGCMAEGHPDRDVNKATEYKAKARTFKAKAKATSISPRPGQGQKQIPKAKASVFKAKAKANVLLLQPQ